MSQELRSRSRSPISFSYFNRLHFSITCPSKIADTLLHTNQIVPPELIQLLFTILTFKLAPMAETIPMGKLSLSPEQQDSDRLMKQLEEKYNMPHEKWWDGVETTFRCLQAALERGQDDIVHEEDDHQSISAQAARADALPLVSLLPSGSHALRLTATNEDLQCVAFGTISAERFVEIFWETVNFPISLILLPKILEFEQYSIVQGFITLECLDFKSILLPNFTQLCRLL